MPRVLAVLLVCLLAFAGCGGDDSSSSSSDGSGTETTPANVVDFPPGEGKTMRALRDLAPEKGIFAPSVSVLRKGENRIGFALFDTSRKQLTPDAVALYLSDPKGRGLRGPFEARRESLRVKPQFQSQQAAADLEDVDSFWVADVTFPKNGKYVLTALMSLDGELTSTSQMEMPPVGAKGGPPDIGDKAISVHTDTVASAGGDLESIDTRLPPLAELHEKDLADVLGKEPVVLAMATPQLCQTRVCGPIVDVAAEVRNETDGVTFIHQEIYNENQVDKGFREPVIAWRLPTEPWVFLISRDRKIVDRFEGAVSVRELSEAVKKLGVSVDRDETEAERADRNMIELLQELRVAVTGVQVLFAFLLTVPFTSRFRDVTSFQEKVYFVTLLLSAAATAFLIAPSPYHRLNFQQRDKTHIVAISSRWAIVGIGFLGLAMTGAVMLVTDFLFGDVTVTVTTGVTLLLFALLWFILPLWRRAAFDGDSG